MNKGLLAGSVLLLAVSLACITVAVVQVIRQVWPMWSVRFVGSAGFHAVAAVIAQGRYVTYDLKPSRDDPTAVGTSEMVDAIIDAM